MLWLTVRNWLAAQNIWRYRRGNAYTDVVITGVFSVYITSNFQEQSPPWEANRPSVSQEFPRILWHMNVHYRLDKVSHLSLSWARSIHWNLLISLLRNPSEYYRPIYVKIFQEASFLQASPTYQVCTSPLSQNMLLVIISKSVSIRDWILKTERTLKILLVLYLI
jgi:hypothetical protein